MDWRISDHDHTNCNLYRPNSYRSYRMPAVQEQVERLRRHSGHSGRLNRCDGLRSGFVREADA